MRGTKAGGEEESSYTECVSVCGLMLATKVRFWLPLFRKKHHPFFFVRLSFKIFHSSLEIFCDRISTECVYNFKTRLKTLSLNFIPESVFENTKAPIKKLRSLSISTLDSNFFIKPQWHVFPSAIKGTNCSIARAKKKGQPSPRLRILSARNAINFRTRNNTS